MDTETELKNTYDVFFMCDRMHLLFCASGFMCYSLRSAMHFYKTFITAKWKAAAGFCSE
jgi:hypothetical protein